MIDQEYLVLNSSRSIVYQVLFLLALVVSREIYSL